jgi:hypothetical protein
MQMTSITAFTARHATYNDISAPPKDRDNEKTDSQNFDHVAPPDVVAGIGDGCGPRYTSGQLPALGYQLSAPDGQRTRIELLRM